MVKKNSISMACLLIMKEGGYTNYIYISTIPLYQKLEVEQLMSTGMGMGMVTKWERGRGSPIRR